jgi:hypothetical protein
MEGEAVNSRSALDSREGVTGGAAGAFLVWFEAWGNRNGYPWLEVREYQRLRECYEAAWTTGYIKGQTNNRTEGSPDE